MASNYQLFVAGNVLTAAQVNSNLQRQVLVQCDAAADRTALPSVQGMMAYQKDTGEWWIQEPAGTWQSVGLFSEWSSFTPSMSGWAVAGSISGRYQLMGKKCTFEIRVVAGGSTTFGAALTVGLPFTAKTSSNDGWTGTAYFYDSSTGFYYPGVAPIASAGTTTIPRASATNGVSGSSPFAWATGDVVQISGTYEVA